MSEVKIAKVRVLEILDVYPDGQYLARVEEIPVVDNPVYEVSVDTSSFYIDTNGTLHTGDTIPAGTKLKLMDCNLGEYMSPFKYTYVDAEGKYQNKVVFMTDANLKHISGSLGQRVENK
jgi:hypothetical protein